MPNQQDEGGYTSSMVANEKEKEDESVGEQGKQDNGSGLGETVTEIAGEATAIAGKVGEAAKKMMGMGPSTGTGVLVETDKHALYAGAWLVISPSLMEGFGMPVADALMLGKPTIVADNSNLKDLVTDSRFRFTHASGALSLLIHNLLASDDLYRECGEYAKARKHSLLSWTDVVDNLLNWEVKRWKEQKTISPA